MQNSPRFHWTLLIAKPQVTDDVAHISMSKEFKHKSAGVFQWYKTWVLPTITVKLKTAGEYERARLCAGIMDGETFELSGTTELKVTKGTVVFKRIFFTKTSSQVG